MDKNHGHYKHDMTGLKAVWTSVTRSLCGQSWSAV